MNIELIENAKNAWKFFSMWAMGLATALEAAWIAVPADMKSGIPPNLISGISIGLLVLGMLGRIVKQPVATP